MSSIRSLKPAEGFSREIGHYVAALEETRSSLVRRIEELSTEALARRAYAGANTIGTLLVHIGEAELFWLQVVVRGEPLSAKQREDYRVEVFGRPGAPAVEARDFGYFRKRLDEARGVTLATLQRLSDADLETTRIWKDEKTGEAHEFTVRWILHHVLEHEAHHRGQVFLLKRALGY